MCDGISGVLLYPLSDIFVSLLCDLRCSCLPGAYGPHRFISDDYLGPVLDARLKSIKLYLQYVVCVPGLSLLQVLPDAYDRTEGMFLASLNLHGNYFICLFEMLTALTVPDYRPIDPEIFYLLSFNFSGLLSFRG